MKMKGLIAAALAGLFLITGCGKPNDPESINPNATDVTGGYKIVKRFLTPGYAQDVVKKDSLVYMAEGEGGLVIVNVADPENPQVVSVTTENVRGYSAKIAMKDSAVYLAAGSFGLTVVDVSDPFETDVTVSNLSLKPARDMEVMGDYIFVAISEEGVGIAEVSYAIQPDVRGTITTNGYAYDIAITADTSYLLAACGEMGLSIFDISDFQQGFGVYRRIGWCDTPGHAEAITIIDEDSIAFMACGTAGLQILNYADTSNIFIVGTYSSGGYAKDLLLKGQRIYLTTENRGLQIVDISDVTNPKKIGVVETGYALGLDIDDDYVYLADEVEGLIIISIPD
jgi:hypothetical protein